MKKVERKDRKVLTIFLLLLPSLLIALAASISSVVVRIVFQMILLFMQYILLKNLIDDFYGEE